VQYASSDYTQIRKRRLKTVLKSGLV
jgi:hypothetical protein